MTTLRTSLPTISIGGTRGVGAGRRIHASQSFQPGDLIATFPDPVLVLPDGPSSKVVCNHCLAHGIKPRACSGCKAIVYCSPSCQKANWVLIHKQECKAYRRVRDSVKTDWLPTPVRALVQILLRYEEEGIRTAIENLESNLSSFEKRKDLWKDIDLQAVAGVTYSGKAETDEELSLARNLLCKIQTNAFDRSDVDIGQQTGVFLDPILAMVNHSCLPNAAVSFIGRKAFLRAEVPIKGGDEITISYIGMPILRYLARC